MKRGRPPKNRDNIELITFRCEVYPELFIYNLKVKFIDGKYMTDKQDIIKILRETKLPIIEVK